jgi:hypothetical protein
LRACSPDADCPLPTPNRCSPTSTKIANGGVDTREIVAAIRAFCLQPAAQQPGSWLFGTI